MLCSSEAFAIFYNQEEPFKAPCGFARPTLMLIHAYTYTDAAIDEHTLIHADTLKHHVQHHMHTLSNTQNRCPYYSFTITHTHTHLYEVR